MHAIRSFTVAVIVSVVAGCGVNTSSLMALASEPPGGNCQAGGVRIVTGIDDNGDGTLETIEVDKTEYACNGRDGKHGTNGTDGNNGTNGISTLTAVVYEAPGTNCVDGGVRVDVGRDLNGDRALTPEEYENTEYLCDGKDGYDGLGTLTRLANEDAGTNCVQGGVRIESGVDADHDGTLETGEVTSVGFVCNGADGADGASGANGADGTNGTNGTNGTSGTNGTNGYNSLSSLTVAPLANCPDGGVRIQTGLDTNRSNTLDTGEVTQTQYVCNGADGADGTNGTPSEIAYAYTSGEIVSDANVNVTLQQVSITIPAPGKIAAIASVDAFCTSTAGQVNSCADGDAAGYITIADNGTADATAVHPGYFWLSADTTESITRATTFTAGVAGTYTFYVRAKATDALGAADKIGFYRRALTLIYVAD